MKKKIEKMLKSPILEDVLLGVSLAKKYLKKDEFNKIMPHNTNIPFSRQVYYLSWENHYYILMTGGFYCNRAYVWKDEEIKHWIEI